MESLTREREIMKQPSSLKMKKVFSCSDVVQPAWKWAWNMSSSGMMDRGVPGDITLRIPAAITTVDRNVEMKRM
eukprot:CAMPEP_0118654014 /NCGR_PEP_ID=MMETSP0785-20121206/12138_1 /TAXON_ID=91992 /ORGANISM="Bolidomonas pacifica, Strain CCMP 1866" /LENGTH=73 /DNA_ID=CAMNT_0006546595 /DNA_START=169 /DNA_END=390 /DNA_ORIENTATION=-